MKDLRTKSFFWIGILILPVFWSWFTLRKSFSGLERAIAFSWLGLYLVLCLVYREHVLNYLFKFTFGYPFISAWMTMAFCLWLLFRAGFLRNPIEILVVINIVGIASSQVIPKFYEFPAYLLIVCPLIPMALVVFSYGSLTIGFNSDRKPGPPSLNP